MFLGGLSFWVLVLCGDDGWLWEPMMEDEDYERWNYLEYVVLALIITTNNGNTQISRVILKW